MQAGGAVGQVSEGQIALMDHCFERFIVSVHLNCGSEVHGAISAAPRSAFAQNTKAGK